MTRIVKQASDNLINRIEGFSSPEAFHSTSSSPSPLFTDARELHSTPPVFGTAGNDFIHTTGDGRTAPPGYNEIIGGNRVEFYSGLDGDDFIYANPYKSTLDGGNGNDVLDGEGGKDTLLGRAGDDTLYGGDYNDQLDGGAGADSMSGGTGNDTYVVDDPNDVVIENFDEGTFDLISSSVDHVLEDNVEGLVLTGSAARGAGNELNNTIRTSSTALLLGYGGNDFLVGSSESGDRLYGGDGNDTLNGGAGADFMVGGKGRDTYYVDDTGDTIVEQDPKNSTVVAAISYTLGDDLGKSTLYENGIYGTGNASDNTIIGSSADNVLDGGGGNDTMSGGHGNDTFLVDDGDVVMENAGEGRDTIISSETYVLPQNVEDLVVSGDAAGTGNVLSNRLTGGDGSNALDGQDGQDILTGGADADLLTGGAGADLFVFLQVEDSTPGAADTIADFEHGNFELIDLSQIDANTTKTGNQAFSLGGDTFTNTAGELIQYADDFGHTIVAGDVNGDGSADFQIILDGAPALVEGDFLL